MTRHGKGAQRGEDSTITRNSAKVASGMTLRQLRNPRIEKESVSGPQGKHKPWSPPKRAFARLRKRGTAPQSGPTVYGKKEKGDEEIAKGGNSGESQLAILAQGWTVRESARGVADSRGIRGRREQCGSVRYLILSRRRLQSDGGFRDGRRSWKNPDLKNRQNKKGGRHLLHTPLPREEPRSSPLEKGLGGR